MDYIWNIGEPHDNIICVAALYPCYAVFTITGITQPKYSPLSMSVRMCRQQWLESSTSSRRLARWVLLTRLVPGMPAMGETYISVSISVLSVLEVLCRHWRINCGVFRFFSQSHWVAYSMAEDGRVVMKTVLARVLVGRNTIWKPPLLLQMRALRPCMPRVRWNSEQASHTM